MALSETEKNPGMADEQSLASSRGLADGEAGQRVMRAGSSLEPGLSSEELGNLDEILSKASHPEFSSMEGLDGFLVALALSPNVSYAGYYLDGVCDKMKKGDKICFESAADEIKFRFLALRHLQYLLLVLDDKNQKYAPILREMENQGSDWAKGFLHQNSMDDMYWDDLFHVEEEKVNGQSSDDLYSGIMELAWGVEVDYDKPINELDIDISAKRREEIIQNIVPAVELYHQLAGAAYERYKMSVQELEEKERLEEQESSEKEKAKRKLGRNDPCPCGSGKKYKRCCGQ